MIKEILQENNNKSYSREKVKNDRLNSILNGLNIFKEFNLIKKEKHKYTFKKKKNLKLSFNNFFTKKPTNIKAFPPKKNNTIIYRNNLTPFDKRINYTTRNNFLKEEKTNEETKIENNYFTERMNSFNKKVINNLNEEYEIRYLNKKIEKLRSKKEEIENNLNYIKNKNNSLNSELIKEENNLNNLLFSLKNIYNIFFLNGINKEENNLEIKNLLLDLMDIKYNYENAILVNTFLQNLDDSINMNNIFNSNNDIYSNISLLLEMKNKLIDDINKINENEIIQKKYSEFCKDLFHMFETNDLDNIYISLKEIISNNEDNNKKISQMKSILYNNNDNDYNNNSYYEKLNTNINPDKITSNKRKNLSLNYSDLNKFILENNDINTCGDLKRNKFNLMKVKNSSFLTDRRRLTDAKDFISKLRNKNNIQKKNNKIDIDKINKFSYTPKIISFSSRSHLNKSMFNLYNKESNKEDKIENHKEDNDDFKNFINSVDNQKENISTKNKHDIIPSLKNINNYIRNYYK